MLSLRAAPALGTVIVAMNGVTYIPSPDELRRRTDTLHADGGEGAPLSPEELLRVQPNIGWFLKELARPRPVRTGRSTILASGWDPAPGEILGEVRR